MKKIVLTTALLIAAALILTRLLAYQFFAQNIRLELYLAIVGAVFLGLGIYAGLIWKRGSGTAPSFEIKDKDGLLSERETEVLKLLAEGYSNKEIADRLFVSVNTVKTHLGSIYGKLGVSRRTQAVAAARKLQMLEIEN